MGGVQASRLALHAALLALLGACAGGGGGGGGGGVLSPPPPPPPVTFPPLAAPHANGDFPTSASSEFTADWGPAGINAQIAWQNGATGAGILVGVIDDGIDPNHPELAGRISPDSTDIVQVGGARRDALVTTNSHGSELSSLIAGNYNGAQTVGVAFDATILAVRADNGAHGFFDDDLANAINYAVAHGVRVINLSLGGSFVSNTALQNAISNATANNVIIVASAGNDGPGVAPNYPGALATNASISNGLVLIAGGLDASGAFNVASNPAGATANYYLTAPGWDIIVPDYGPAGPVFINGQRYQYCGPELGLPSGLCQIQGTSYASPHVAGAVALVMDGFPGLSATQVVNLLLTTTDDTGVPGTDAVMGRGRLNVGRAFQPVGPLSAPIGGMQVSQMSILGAVGPAFGDGLTQNASAWTVTGFDSFGRSFAMNLASNWLNAAHAPSALVHAPLLWRAAADQNGMRMQMALADSVAPDTMRLPADRADLEQPHMRIDATLAPGLTATIAAHGARADYEHQSGASHLDMANPDISLGLTRQLTDNVSLSFISESGSAPSGLPLTPSSARDAMAARAAFAFGRTGFDVTFGQLHEEAGVLGLTWGRDFGATPDGETSFAGFGAHVDAAPGVRLSLAAEYGVADLQQAGWLDVAEPLRTSAFSLEARFNTTPDWLDGQGALTLSLSQPLRVESGALSYMAPTSDAYGVQNLSYEQRTFSPTPSGRELRFGLGYSYWSGETLSAFGEAIYVTEPGHVAGADPDAVLRVGLRVAH